MSAWYSNLIDRVEFFRNWYLNGVPAAFWISAFYFPQGFLTSVLQNYSRSSKIAIDKLSFAFEFKNIADPVALQAGPEVGVLIYGVYIEAARFDLNKMTLIDNQPGVMQSEAPVIYFVPKESYTPDVADYACPVYKTMARAGVVSGTGQSGYILNVYCPTKIKPEYWILNGVAFICSLNY